MRTRGVLAFVSLLVVLALVGFAAVADDHGSSGKDFEFSGTISALPASGTTGDWTVSGKTVHVTATTLVKLDKGPAAVGASVEGKGTLNTDGSISASEIEVKGAKDNEQEANDFVGAITALPSATGFVGDWTVGGKTVHVTATTQLNAEGGTFAVGASVEVEGTTRTDGSIDATKIELKSAGPGGMPPGEMDFRGAVESLPATGVVGDWMVSGKVVHVSATTRIEAEHGTPMVGAFVEVEGTTHSDGSIDAVKIEVKMAPQPPGTPAPTEFKGAVESLPAAAGFVGDAVVSGKTIHITATTRIDQEDGALAVGAMVEVKGAARTDGSIDATRIEVEFGEDSGASGQANDFHLSSAARKAGLNGSFFTTSLTLSNTGTADATVTVKFLGHDQDGRNGLARTVTVPAGATLTIDDLLGSFFGIGDDFGGVRITSNVPTLVVDSHTGTPSGQGSFGQQLRATEHNDLITSSHPRSIAGVRSNGAFRTNLMLTNATEKPLDVDVKLIGSDGRQLGSSRVHLEPLEMHQVNDAARELNGGAETGDDARLVLSTATPNGAFAAAASRIDNVSNDPSALLPR